MAILPILDARSFGTQLDALSRLVDDNQKQLEELFQQLTRPEIRELHQQLAELTEPTRRLVRELGASGILRHELDALAEPTIRLHEQINTVAGGIENLNQQLVELGEPTRELTGGLAAALDLNRDFEALIEPAGLFRDQISAVLGAADRFQKEFAELADPMRDLSARLDEIQIPAQQLANFSREFESAWLQAAEAFSEYVGTAERQIDRDVAKLLMKRGWLGIDRHLKTSELMNLLRVKGRNKGGRIDLAICKAFKQKRAARLKRMTKGWQRLPYLKARALSSNRPFGRT